MRISGLNKLTLLDYPGKMACTVFLAGCNVRCPFCHNASLVLDPTSQPEITEEELMTFLDNRKGILEGVCVTGGEPTLSNDLPEFLRKIKDKGYFVKLDTNGTNPDMIEKVISFVDYFAMDIKNSKEHYAETVGVGNFNIEPIERSIEILMKRAEDYEFRTTVVAELHAVEDFDNIGKWIAGAKALYLQRFKDSGDIIGRGFSAPSEDLMKKAEEILSKYVKHVAIRG